MRRALALIVLAAALPAAAAVDLRAAARLGVVIAPVGAAPAAPAGTVATATVLDAGALITQLEELDGLRATAAASAADAQRQRGLYAGNQDVARRVAEAAEAVARGDLTRVRAAEGRLAQGWSPALRRPAPALKAGMADGSLRLVRIEGAARPLAAGRVLALVRVDGRHVRARVLGPASGPAVLVPGPAWLAVAADASLSTAEPLTARIDAPGAGGGFVPAGAAVLVGGRYFLFVQQGGALVRTALAAGARAVPGGWSVPRLAPGTRVVVAGAGALLSAEQGAAGHADR